MAIPKNSIMPFRPHKPPPTNTSSTVSPTISTIVLIVFMESKFLQ